MRAPSHQEVAGASGRIRESLWTVKSAPRAPLAPACRWLSCRLWGGVGSGRCWLSRGGGDLRLRLWGSAAVKPHFPECQHCTEMLSLYVFVTRHQVQPGCRAERREERRLPPAGRAALLLLLRRGASRKAPREGCPWSGRLEARQGLMPRGTWKASWRKGEVSGP